MTRAAACTAMPPMCRPLISISPVWRPARSGKPISFEAVPNARAQRTPRPGQSWPSLVWLVRPWPISLQHTRVLRKVQRRLHLAAGRLHDAHVRRSRDRPTEIGVRMSSDPSLLRPEDCALLLVDLQAGLAFGVGSEDRQVLLNNAVALA